MERDGAYKARDRLRRAGARPAQTKGPHQVKSMVLRPGGLAAFGLAAAAAGIGLGSYGLVEPSDARYAEISREMWASGDFLFPRLLGIHHFHKPPLIYWLSAIGYSAFGVNEWGARACLWVMSLALAVVVWRFARKHLSEEAGPWAAVCLATMPAVVGAGRMLTTDLLLALCLTLALTSWYDVWTGKGGRGSVALFHGSTGLAFLAKGPVAWLVLALILVPFWLLERRRAPKKRVSWGLAWGLPLTLGLALSWYLYAVVTTPGLLSYFLGGQIASRLREGGLGHAHPWYYYLGLFPVLGLPWLFFVPSGWAVCQERTPRTALFLSLWVLVPPLFFSFPATKLPLYVLPAYPALALLAAAAISDDLAAPVKALRATGVFLLLLGIALGLLGLGVIRLRGGDLAAIPREQAALLLLPLALCILAVGVVVLAEGAGRPRRAAAAAAVGLALLPAWAFSQGALLPFRSARTVGLAARAELKAGDLLVEYGDLSSGVAFYSRQIPLLAKIDREAQFEEGEAASRMLSRDRFLELWNGPRRVLAVTRSRRRWDFPGARKLAEGGQYALYANR